MSSAPVISTSRRQAWELGLLFGVLYFVVGVTEPTEGIVAQPVRSLMVNAGDSTGTVTLFAALLTLPWCFKPLYGLCSDFIPWWGMRRKNYLIVTSGAAAAAYFILSYIHPAGGSVYTLLAVLLIPTTAVAWADVVVDAVMVEMGLPRGLTGRFQSIQWTAMWGGAILCGWLGGQLSAANAQNLAFFTCGALMFGTFLLTIFFVHEGRPPTEGYSFADDMRELGNAWRSASVRFTCLFLFVWTFNPITNTFVYAYMTGPLKIDDVAYGNSQSMLALGALLGSATYGVYCRWFRLATLLHGSILCGILATVVYAVVSGPTSLNVVSLLVGWLHMSGTMVQLDLAARSCPVRVAGTVFATVMALSNLSALGATAMGGWVYDLCRDHLDSSGSFNVLLVIGSLTTALCWLMMPFLPEQVDYVAAKADVDEPEGTVVLP